MGSYKQLIWFSITTFITFSPYLVFADSHGKSPYEGLSEACYEVLHDSEGKSSEEERVRCYKEFKQLRDITVVVSASRHEEDLKEVSSPTSVLTQQELVRISADNVAEYLRDIPGVEISDAGQAGQKRIRLRGEEASRVLILIDGQEFTDQREVGTPILIAPEMIERIEVVRGPSSVLYGSKAIGGVINIITKKGGYHPFQATVSHLYDSSTTGHQSFGSLYGSVDWFDYRLSVGKAHHGLRDTPVGEIENTGFEWDTLSAYVGGKFDNHSVGVSYDNYQSASDVFVEDEVRTTPPFLDFQLDIPQRDREKFAFVYDGKNFSESLVKLHLDTFYQQSDRTFNTFSETFFNFGFPLFNETFIGTTSDLENVGVTLQSDWEVGDSHYVVAGYQFVQDDLVQDRERLVTTNAVPTPSELIHEEASRVSHSLFLQDEWDLSPNWQMTFGGRAFWFDSELDETTRVGFSPGKNSDESVIGTVAFSYFGIPDTTLWLRWAQGYLFPTLNQSATGAFAGPDFVNPNAALQPETSHTFDFGVRYEHGAYSTDMSVFAAIAEDYIDFVRCSETQVVCLEDGGRSPRVYINADRAKSFGAEFTARYESEVVTPYASLAWLRRKLTRDGFSTYDSGIPVIMTRTGIRRDLELAPSLHSWIDAYTRFSSDSDERDGVGPTGVEHKAGWGTFNISAGLEIGKKRDVRIVADIINIFDKIYTPAQENLIAPGTAALVRVVVDLS